jgi:hypothetical protein
MPGGPDGARLRPCSTPPPRTPAPGASGTPSSRTPPPSCRPPPRAAAPGRSSRSRSPRAAATGHATAVFRVTLEPGHRGFEQALQVAYGLAEDGLSRPDGTPKDLRAGALVAEWADARVDGAYRLLTPVLGLLARRARRKGLDRELLARYVRV